MNEKKVFLYPVKRWAGFDYVTQWCVMEGDPACIAHSMTIAAFFDTQEEAESWANHYRTTGESLRC